MVDKKDKSVSKEEKIAMIFKESMKPLNKNHPLRCIDDRLLAQTLDYKNLPDFVVKSEETDGPQILGGSYSIFDLALELAPKNIEVSFDLVYDLTQKAHTDSGYVMGIHMDNHHDEMDKGKIEELLSRVTEKEEVKISGCGYDSLVRSDDNPLDLSEKSVAFHKKYPNRAALFIKRGARLSILGGHHAPKEKALAVINTRTNETLDAPRAHKLDQPIYNHDQKPFEEILNALSIDAAKIDPEWGKNIRVNGNNLYMKWYTIVANKLAGMTPIQD